MNIIYMDYTKNDINMLELQSLVKNTTFEDNDSLNKNTITDSVQFISFDEDDEFNIIFHENNFETIIKQVPKNIPISIISIIGAFRTGKSFILNILLKYLEYSVNSGLKYTENFFNNLDEIPGNKNCINNGFVWCNGIDSQTMGIWMWNKPIIYNHPIDGKIAIILMDTQGLFDLNTNQRKTITLFGLSSLISSHIIYNVDKRIQEDNLQHLALFSAYGQLVNKNFRDSGKCLQTLQFLVRDWQNFDNNCMEPEEYINKILSDRNSSDLNNTRNQIKNCFNKIKCSFLPHPGLKATKNNFNGSIYDIDKNFIKHVKKYIEDTLINNSLEVKKIGGVEVKKKEIIKLVKNYLDIFRNEKGFPKAVTILESTIMIQHNIAIEKSLELFVLNMEVINTNGNKYLHPFKFSKLIEKNKKISLTIFNKNCTLGDNNVILNSKDILIIKLQNEENKYKKLNEERRPLKFLGPYLIPIISIIFSYIFSKIFYTCSATVTICSELYILFLVSYYLSISVVIIFFLAKYYLPIRYI
jgi:atlastin